MADREQGSVCLGRSEGEQIDVVGAASFSANMFLLFQNYKPAHICQCSLYVLLVPQPKLCPLS